MKKGTKIVNNIRESDIQARIIKRLEQQGYMVVKLVLTNMNGIPDLLLLKDGVASFVEVKRPGCKLRELQAYRAEQLRSIGFDVQVMTE